VELRGELVVQLEARAGRVAGDGGKELCVDCVRAGTGMGAFIHSVRLDETVAPSAIVPLGAAFFIWRKKVKKNRPESTKIH
jgi:hypothetical protein